MSAESRVQIFRSALLALAVAGLLVSTGAAAKLGGISCASECRELHALGGPAVPVLGALGIAALAVALWTRRFQPVFPALSIATGSVALALLGVMLAQRKVCPGCLLADGSLVCLALTNVRRRWIGLAGHAALACSVAAVLIAARTNPAAESDLFTLRPYESAIEGSEATIVFTDPECPTCRNLYRNRAALPGPVHYRWYLLSSYSERSIPTVAAIEALSTTDRGKADRLRAEIAGHAAPFTFETLERTLEKIGEPGKALRPSSVPSSILETIARDGELAASLGVDGVPAVFRAKRSGEKWSFTRLPWKDFVTADAPKGASGD